MMMLLIGFIVVAIDFAARESSWYWLTGTPEGTTSQSEPQQSSGEKRKVIFRPEMDSDSLPRKVFRIGRSEDDENGNGQTRSSDSLSVASEQIRKIRNNTVGIRAAEREVYHDVLALARDTPVAEQREAAIDDVAFAVLMTESEQFLGKPLTVKGELCGLQKIPPGANHHGIEELWEAWMKNADSGENLYVVRSTDIPAGIPTGMELKSGTIVEVTGFFFKRYGYPTRDDRLHVAPMILAKSLKWYKPREVQKPNDLGLVPYVLAFAGIIGGSICLLLWKFRAGDRQFERQHLKRLTEAPREAISAINDLPVIDIGESLRQMSDAESAPADSEDG